MQSPCTVAASPSCSKRSASLDARWEWMMRDPALFVAQGGTGRIRVTGIPDKLPGSPHKGQNSDHNADQQSNAAPNGLLLFHFVSHLYIFSLKAHWAERMMQRAC